MKKIQISFTGILILISCFLANAQCISNVNFNNWSQAGWIDNGNWLIENNGSQVHQTVNGRPTFFITPFELMNVRITGNFMSKDIDNDFMGFVFGFKNPIGESDNYNTWLFDWKKEEELNGNYLGNSGMALSRVNGVIMPGDYLKHFWAHETALPKFELIQNNFGSQGWVRNFNHSLTLELTYTRAKVYIDGNLIFDESGCFPPGHFGFYNFSQKECFYSNFQYSLFVDFSVLTPQVCPGDTAKFRFLDTCAASNYNLNQYSSISWDYGDGTSETISNPTLNNVNPSHVYSQPGNYMVTISVVDAQGCTASSSQQIEVLPYPEINITAQQVCFSNEVIFNELGGNNILSRKWDFGDGSNFSYTANPTHQYPGPGTYTVNLSVESTTCAGNQSFEVIVNPDPIAKFNYGPACIGAPMSFSDVSSTFGDSIVQWEWNFGDNSPFQNIKDPIHIYSAPGNFDVRLRITTANNCSVDTVIRVAVHPQPVTNFSFESVCAGTEMKFTDQSTINSGSIISRIWNFGDGNIDSSSLHPIHIFGNGGLHDVKLNTISDSGCIDSLVKEVIVFHLPEAQFTASDVCLGTASIFENTSSILTGSISTFQWDFGNGTFSNARDTSLEYAVAGQYDVTLIATSDNNCVGNANQRIEIFPLPVVDFSFDNQEGCVPLEVNFTDLSQIESGQRITTRNWSFGENNTSNAPNPQHVYTSAGLYSVSLQLQTEKGCIATKTLDNLIRVHQKPIAAFTVSPEKTTLKNPVIKIWDLSAGAIHWEYYFDDNTLSNEANPEHLYSDTGTYNIRQVVKNRAGCTDTAWFTVQVGPDFTFYIPNAFSPDGDGINDVFAGVGSGISSYEMEIYSRWGELIFTSGNIDVVWDGKFGVNQTSTKQDAYVYTFRIVDSTGKSHKFTGTVILLAGNRNN